MGQSLLGMPSAPRLSEWILFIPFLLPWLTICTISFCRQPPFGLRRFRHCLLFAMCWYAAMTLIAEILYIVAQPRAAHKQADAVVGHVLTYGGMLSFIVFARACRQLRRYEAIQHKQQLYPMSRDSLNRPVCEAGRQSYQHYPVIRKTDC